MMKENNCGKQSKGRNSDKVKTNPTSTLNSEKTTVGNGSQFELEEMIKRMIAKEVAPLKSKIESLKAEVTELCESQGYISARYDISREYTRLQTDSNKQKVDIMELTTSTKNLEKKSCDDEDKINQLEQYDRRQNLEFKGLAYQKNEDVSQLVINVAEKIGVKLQKADTSVAHRLPTKPGRGKNGPNTVIARFVKRKVRNKIYYKRYLLKDLHDDKHDDSQKRVYINENLTQKRKRLFWLAKQKIKALQYKFIWTNNGYIFVRKDIRSEKISIKNENDCNHLK